VRALGADYYGSGSHFGLWRKDLRRLLRTLLQRLVVDTTAVGGARFACDVAGNTDDTMDRGGNVAGIVKSCTGSRELSNRHVKAANLLPLAVAARDDPKAHCDALSVVDAILPLFLQGHDDLVEPSEKNICKECTSTLSLLEAKYWFYWYQRGVEACRESMPSPAPTMTPAPSVCMDDEGASHRTRTHSISRSLATLLPYSLAPSLPYSRPYSLDHA
jgi:hypothetical protein